MREKSTGPRSPEGMARSAQNAFKGGTRPLLLMLARSCADSRNLYMNSRDLCGGRKSKWQGSAIFKPQPVEKMRPIAYPELRYVV